MIPRSLAVIVALLPACENRGEPAPQWPRSARTYSSSAFMTVASGGALTVQGVELAVPPSTLLWDTPVELEVETSAGGPDYLLRTVRVTPWLSFRGEATLAVNMFGAERPTTATYTASDGYRAYITTTTEDGLVISLDHIGILTILRGECRDTTCESDHVCQAESCIARCDSDPDCSGETWCDFVLGGVATIQRFCDQERHVCLDHDLELTPCARGCNPETLTCFDANSCPPPKHPWPGPRGICLCGAPKVRCAAVDPDGSTPPWVDAECDTFEDCQGLGCDEPVLCLEPGQMYPGCMETGVDLIPECYYDTTAPLGSCAVLCGAP